MQVELVDPEKMNKFQPRGFGRLSQKFQKTSKRHMQHSSKAVQILSAWIWFDKLFS
jgi:hypothetical protein